MLTVQQLYFPLVSFHFFTKIGLLPLVIDVKTGRITRRTSKTLWCSWYVLLVLSALLHGGFITRQFINFLSSSANIEIHDLPMVANLLIFLAALYLFPTAYVRYCDVTLTTFNSLFQGNTFISSHPVVLANSLILFSTWRCSHFGTFRQVQGNGPCGAT